MCGSGVLDAYQQAVTFTVEPTMPYPVFVGDDAIGHGATLASFEYDNGLGSPSRMMSGLAGPALVYFYPGIDEPPGPQPLGRQWSLTGALAKRVPVVVVSTEPASRGRITQLSERLSVVRGCTEWRDRRLASLIGLSPRLDQRSLDAALESMGIRDHRLWLSIAEPSWTLRGYRGERLIYDCIDPCLGDQCGRHERAEQRVCERAGIVFATAQTLLDRVGAWTADPVPLRNGCADLGMLPDPPTGTPVVGYLGTVDSRVAVGPLLAAAKALPHAAS